MRCKRPGRVAALATLLAAAFWTTSLASAQVEGPPFRIGDVAGAPAVAEAVAAGETSVPEDAPPEGPPPGHAPSFFKMVLLDSGHVLSSPARWRSREWFILAGATAALATMSVADEPLSDAAREHGPTFGTTGDTLEEFGGGGSILLLGGFYLAGAIGKDSKAKDVCVDGLVASLIATGMITPVLGTLIGRERPTEEEGAYSFHPFEGRAFPSGHATQAFAVASVIATSYDQYWVKATVYGVAALTAYERVRRGKHFPTDVVAGAAIGTLVGHSVVHFNRKLRSGEREPEATGARLTVIPVLGGGAYGLSATLDF